MLNTILFQQAVNAQKHFSKMSICFKEIEAGDDGDRCYFKCKCYHRYKKHVAPYTIQVALCIKSGKWKMPLVHVMQVKLAYHILELVFKFVNIRCLKAKQLRKTSWMNPMEIHLWHVLQTPARTSLSGLPFPKFSLSLRGRERGEAHAMCKSTDTSLPSSPAAALYFKFGIKSPLNLQ